MKVAIMAGVHGLTVGLVLLFFDTPQDLARTAAIIVTAVHLKDWYNS